MKSQNRLRNICLIVYDFDGVMTDNRVMVTEDNKESVMVNRGDGLAVKKIKEAGIGQIIISTETNRVVKVRADKLQIPVIQASENKLLALQKYLSDNRISKENVIYVGNDINDKEAMNYVKWPIAPADAHNEIKKTAKIVLKTRGGYGVVRELLDKIEFTESSPTLAIFITVRTDSTRLPKKCLLKIKGKRVIEHLIERVKNSKLKDLIVLCTTKLKEDNILCNIASKQGIKYFRGSVKDKLSRWYGAAKKYNVGFFVTADGDDLFCEPELIDLAFKQYMENNADFIEGQNVPCGAFTYGIKTEALKKVCEIKGTADTEMMWTYFKDTSLFKCEKLKNIDVFYKRPEIRMTLDYPEDFKFFTTVINHFSRNKKYFNLRAIISYLDKHPEVIRINQHLQEIFLANQRKKTKLIIKGGRSI